MLSSKWGREKALTWAEAALIDGEGAHVGTAEHVVAQAGIVGDPLAVVSEVGLVAEGAGRPCKIAVSAVRAKAAGLERPPVLGPRRIITGLDVEAVVVHATGKGPLLIDSTLPLPGQACRAGVGAPLASEADAEARQGDVKGGTPDCACCKYVACRQHGNDWGCGHEEPGRQAFMGRCVIKSSRPAKPFCTNCCNNDDTSILALASGAQPSSYRPT